MPHKKRMWTLPRIMFKYNESTVTVQATQQLTQVRDLSSSCKEVSGCWKPKADVGAEDTTRCLGPFFSVPSQPASARVPGVSGDYSSCCSSGTRAHDPGKERSSLQRSSFHLSGQNYRPRTALDASVFIFSLLQKEKAGVWNRCLWGQCIIPGTES